MKIQYVSDLHLEFPDNKAFIKETPILPIADYLVIAGDLGYLKQTDGKLQYENYCNDFLDYCNKKWKMTIIVPGNHEYYGGFHIKETPRKYNLRDNVVLINNNFIDIPTKEDYNILLYGATLWSNINPLEYVDVARDMNDYHCIMYDDNVKFNPGLSIQEYLNTYSFLNNAKVPPYIKNKHNGKPYKMVFVTHHGCHPKCIDDCYRSSKVNSAYSTDLTELITKKAPAVWIYGHTHQTKQFVVNDTVICENSLGYVNYDSTSHFIPDVCINV